MGKVKVLWQTDGLTDGQMRFNVPHAFAKAGDNKTPITCSTYDCKVWLTEKCTIEQTDGQIDSEQTDTYTQYVTL